MTARILVVDDIPINIKLLEAKLLAEYFEVLTANNGEEALEVARSEYPDLILLDVMMPVMDGFETCKRLRSDPATAHIPVVMVTALDGVDDRINGLRAGADDFLTKPIDETALMTRINNLVRLKLMRDELRLRRDTGADLGEILPDLPDDPETVYKVVLLEDRENAAKRLTQTITERLKTDVIAAATPQEAFEAMEPVAPDIIITTLSSANFDGLRFCSQTRSVEFLRHVPILVLADKAGQPELIKALQMGVNDYMVRPIEKNELVARVTSQFRWARYADRLRETYRQTLELATTDPLTGLYNRRYLTPYLDKLIERSTAARKPFSMLVLDIDHFKSVNDTHGHGAGDEILKGFAQRLKATTRGVDLVCRFGGEEFVVLCPDSDQSQAQILAERLRSAIAEQPFQAGPDLSLEITTSIGLATSECGTDTAQSLFERADKALYEAKAAGRNKVICAAA